MMFDLVLLGLGTLAGLLVNHSRQTLKVAEASDKVIAPAGKISVVIPAYNEELYIERVLLDIQNQNLMLQYPDWMEIIVVDNESTDRTAEIASQYATVVSAPRGKLNARHVGVEACSGDIVVFVDADAIVKPNSLNLLLRHFQDPNVVGVSGGSVAITNNPVSLYVNLQMNSLNSSIGLLMAGGFSAFRKEAYYAVGGHNLDVNQSSRLQMFLEEEYGFIRKLKTVGRVVVDLEANIFVPTRSESCQIGECASNSEKSECNYCQEQQKGERF